MILFGQSLFAGPALGGSGDVLLDGQASALGGAAGALRRGAILGGSAGASVQAEAAVAIRRVALGVNANCTATAQGSLLVRSGLAGNAGAAATAGGGALRSVAGLAGSAVAQAQALGVLDLVPVASAEAAAVASQPLLHVRAGVAGTASAGAAAQGGLIRKVQGAGAAFSSAGSSTPVVRNAVRLVASADATAAALAKGMALSLRGEVAFGRAQGSGAARSYLQLVGTATSSAQAAGGCTRVVDPDASAAQVSAQLAAVVFATRRFAGQASAQGSSSTPVMRNAVRLVASADATAAASAKGIALSLRGEVAFGRAQGSGIVHLRQGLGGDATGAAQATGDCTRVVDPDASAAQVSAQLAAAVFAARRFAGQASAQAEVAGIPELWRQLGGYAAAVAEAQGTSVRIALQYGEAFAAANCDSFLQVGEISNSTREVIVPPRVAQIVAPPRNSLVAVGDESRVFTFSAEVRRVAA